MVVRASMWLVRSSWAFRDGISPFLLLHVNMDTCDVVALGISADGVLASFA